MCFLLAFWQTFGNEKTVAESCREVKKVSMQTYKSEAEVEGKILVIILMSTGIRCDVWGLHTNKNVLKRKTCVNCRLA